MNTLIFFEHYYVLRFFLVLFSYFYILGNTVFQYLLWFIILLFMLFVMVCYVFLDFFQLVPDLRTTVDMTGRTQHSQGCQNCGDTSLNSGLQLKQVFNWGLRSEAPSSEQCLWDLRFLFWSKDRSSSEFDVVGCYWYLDGQKDQADT